jgi:exosortase/archaeosortase family protein
LSVDASLVARVLGTHRAGNMVEFADHSGTLAIFPACSSLANVSLALLCWVTVSQYLQHKWRSLDIFWCALACSSVVAVNVIRISLMGISPHYYQFMHGPFAESFVGTMMLILIVGISLLGVRRDAIFRL